MTSDKGPERVWVEIRDLDDFIYDAMVTTSPLKNLRGDVISTEYTRTDLAQSVPEEVIERALVSLRDWDIGDGDVIGEGAAIAMDLENILGFLGIDANERLAALDGKEG